MQETSDLKRNGLRRNLKEMIYVTGEGGKVTEESNSLSKEKVNERDMYKTDREESIVITNMLTRQHSVR